MKIFLGEAKGEMLADIYLGDVADEIPAATKQKIIAAIRNVESVIPFRIDQVSVSGLKPRVDDDDKNFSCGIYFYWVAETADNRDGLCFIYLPISPSDGRARKTATGCTLDYLLCIKSYEELPPYDVEIINHTLFDSDIPIKDSALDPDFNLDESASRKKLPKILTSGDLGRRTRHKEIVKRCISHIDSLLPFVIEKYKVFFSEDRTDECHIDACPPRGWPINIQISFEENLRTSEQSPEDVLAMKSYDDFIPYVYHQVTSFLESNYTVVKDSFVDPEFNLDEGLLRSYIRTLI